MDQAVVKIRLPISISTCCARRLPNLRGPIPGRIRSSAIGAGRVPEASGRSRPGPPPRRQLEERRRRARLRRGPVRFPGRADPARLRLHHAATSIRAENPSAAERMAVVAQGGYGRGLLAPGSDIDLLFLLPYKQTAWGESVAEYMLYLLWDLGLQGRPCHAHDRPMRAAQPMPT